MHGPSRFGLAKELLRIVLKHACKVPNDLNHLKHIASNNIHGDGDNIAILIIVISVAEHFFPGTLIAYAARFHLPHF